MSRYFYTDPLAAAWMGEHFGMEFQTQSKGFTAKWNNRTTGHGESGNIYEIRFGWDEKLERFYIHPDSLHLLEPQIGDLLEGTKPPYSGFMHIIAPEGLPNYIGFPEKPFRIIQRDGKPFFWPGYEAA